MGFRVSGSGFIGFRLCSIGVCYRDMEGIGLEEGSICKRKWNMKWKQSSYWDFFGNGLGVRVRALGSEGLAKQVRIGNKWMVCRVSVY